jgi:hypothetical protein
MEYYIKILTKETNYNKPSLFVDLLYAVLNKHGQKMINKKISKEISNSVAKRLWGSSPSVSSSDVLKSLCDLLFPCPSLCDNLPPKKQMVPESKVKVNVFN